MPGLGLAPTKLNLKLVAVTFSLARLLAKCDSFASDEGRPSMTCKRIASCVSQVCPRPCRSKNRPWASYWPTFWINSGPESAAMLVVDITSSGWFAAASGWAQAVNRQKPNKNPRGIKHASKSAQLLTTIVDDFLIVYPSGDSTYWDHIPPE